jgi:acyl-coenzyme A thioesterase PaaI-like protein
MTATGDAAELLDMINGAMENTIPLAHKIGLRVVEVGRGHAAVTVPAEGNGNHFGVVYAGAQFTAAEILGGIIGLTTFDRTRYFPLVKNVDINFVGMARSELRAEASLDDDTIARVEGEAAEKDKADFDLEVVVTDVDGQIVSITRPLPATCARLVSAAGRQLSTAARRGNVQPGRM